MALSGEGAGDGNNLDWGVTQGAKSGMESKGEEEGRGVVFLSTLRHFPWGRKKSSSRRT